jgi:hypothetical protein
MQSNEDRSLVQANCSLTGRQIVVPDNASRKEIISTIRSLGTKEEAMAQRHVVIRKIGMTQARADELERWISEAGFIADPVARYKGNLGPRDRCLITKEVVPSFDQPGLWEVIVPRLSQSWLAEYWRDRVIPKMLLARLVVLAAIYSIVMPMFVLFTLPSVSPGVNRWFVLAVALSQPVLAWWPLLRPFGNADIPQLTRLRVDLCESPRLKGR